MSEASVKLGPAPDTPSDLPALGLWPDTGIRVLVADAHPVVRAGLRAILTAEPGMSVAGEASDGPMTLALVAELAPYVVVLDAALPGLDGTAVTALLRAGRPGQKVLAFTGCGEPAIARRLLAAGAAGYVLKRAGAAEVVRAIRAVAAGGTYLDPAVAGDLVSVTHPSANGEAKTHELSEREAEVVRMIALGYSNKEIAAQLKVSVKTVETYKTRALEKLHIRSRVELVRYAARHGWLVNV